MQDQEEVRPDEPPPTEPQHHSRVSEIEAAQKGVHAPARRVVNDHVCRLYHRLRLCDAVTSNSPSPPLFLLLVTPFLLRRVLSPLTFRSPDHPSSFFGRRECQKKSQESMYVHSFDLCLHHVPCCGGSQNSKLHAHTTSTIKVINQKIAFYH